jgi:SAM-dependent methyltransferase
VAAGARTGSALSSGVEAAVACPACGGPTVAWQEVAAGEPTDSRRFALVRCELCGTALTLGEPPAPELYEEGMYSPEEPRARGLVDAFQKATVGQPVRLLRGAGLGPQSRVLDAGAGPGRLVAALREGGYDARGIEPSGRSSAIARASGRPVERRAIEEHEEHDLDAVVLWHVLEHLEDPGATLRRLHGWMRPGGLLLLGVPNTASLQAAIGGAGWLHFDAPRHRVHFTPRGLATLVRAQGFAPERTHHLIWEQNPHGMWMAMLARLGMTPGFPFHLLKKNIAPNPRDLALLALGVPLLPVAFAAELAAAAVRRGGTIALVARAV